jgi:hypothetical protein
MDVSDKLKETLEPVLRQTIFDSFLGSVGQQLVIKNVAPTSLSSAEVAFELKLTNSAFEVKNTDIIGFINNATNRYSLEKYLLSNS